MADITKRRVSFSLKLAGTVEVECVDGESPAEAFDAMKKMAGGPHSMRFIENVVLASDDLRVTVKVYTADDAEEVAMGQRYKPVENSPVNHEAEDSFWEVVLDSPRADYVGPDYTDDEIDQFEREELGGSIRHMLGND